LGCFFSFQECFCTVHRGLVPKARWRPRSHSSAPFLFLYHAPDFAAVAPHYAGIFEFSPDNRHVLPAYRFSGTDDAANSASSILPSDFCFFVAVPVAFLTAAPLLFFSTMKRVLEVTSSCVDDPFPLNPLVRLPPPKTSINSLINSRRLSPLIKTPPTLCWGASLPVRRRHLVSRRGFYRPSGTRRSPPDLGVYSSFQADGLSGAPDLHGDWGLRCCLPSVYKFSVSPRVSCRFSFPFRMEWVPRLGQSTRLSGFFPGVSFDIFFD